MNLQDVCTHFGLNEWPTQRAPFAVRLLRKVREDEAGCWSWTASQNGQGYGHVRVGKITVGAHVASYRFFVGPISAGMQIDHLCRNRQCIRPDHLEAVTPRVNAQRTAKATKTHCNHGHELTPDNLVPSRLPGRNCLTCSRVRARQQYERDKWTRPKWTSNREETP